MDDQKLRVPIPAQNQFSKDLFSFHLIDQTGAQRKCVSIGENEKASLWSVITSATARTGKEVLLFAKQRVIEARLHDHIVKMYLEQSTHRLLGRTPNIIKNALRSAQHANMPTSQQCRRVLRKLLPCLLGKHSIPR